MQQGDKWVVLPRGTGFPKIRHFLPPPNPCPRERYAAPLLEQIGERIITRSVSPLCRTVDRALPATRSINNPASIARYT